jgi:hypothetical protein
MAQEGKLGRIGGQAQKELTHNEALLLLDLLVSPVAAGPSNIPPAQPVAGSTYICGSAATGAWSGRDNDLAMWTAAGWRFATPADGQKVVDASTRGEWQLNAGAWNSALLVTSEVRIEGEKVLGRQQPAIADASGGTVVDSEGRRALAEILAVLRSHGLIAA